MNIEQPVVVCEAKTQIDIVGALEDLSIAILRLDHSDNNVDVIRDYDLAKIMIDDLQAALEQLKFCNYMSQKKHRQDAVKLYKQNAAKLKLTGLEEL